MLRALSASFACAVAFAWAPRAAAQPCDTAPAEWLFCDDFESAADADGNLSRWDDQGLHPGNLVLTTNPARVNSGARALEITAHRGVDTGGGPSVWFAPSDVVYVRFYTQFEESYSYVHHYVHVLANRPDDKWAAFGMAGCRPSGSNFFTTGIEPWDAFGEHPPPGAWNFYTYSADMTCDPNCDSYADVAAICDQCASRGSPCGAALECCWGNSFAPAPPRITPRGQWTCVEAMVAANTPGVADGEQALWIDGTEVGRWGGILWRTDASLRIDALGLWHYVTDGRYADGQTQQTVWFDDVVVSTAPIGCLGGPAPADAGPQPGSDGGTGGGTGGGDGGDRGDGGDGGDLDSGCGCRLGARGASHAPWLAVLAVLAAGRCLLGRRGRAQHQRR